MLYLEQLLTTGGGWQDQCGGLYGGAKISRSDTGLPVKITTQQIGIYTSPQTDIDTLYMCRFGAVLAVYTLGIAPACIIRTIFLIFCIVVWLCVVFSYSCWVHGHSE